MSETKPAQSLPKTPSVPVQMMPLVPAVALFGAATGILAASKGFSLIEALLMSVLVFAGASQVAAMEAWTQPLNLIAIVLIVAGVNSRYFLMGATLGPVLRHNGPGRTLFALWMTTDPNWAMTMQMPADQEARTQFLIKSGLFLMALWSSTTAIGFFLGDMITDLQAVGVDLLIMVYFALVILPLWKLEAPLVASWATAILVSLLIWANFGSHTHIIVGALASALVAASFPSKKGSASNA